MIAAASSRHASPEPTPLFPRLRGATLDLDATERLALLDALEFAVGTARRDHGNRLRALVGKLDADTLDRLADRLFLAGGERPLQRLDGGERG